MDQELAATELDGGMCLERRHVLAGLACATLGPASLLSAATPSPSPRPIDVHHHYLPDFWMERTRGWYVGNKQTAEEMVKWTPARALERIEAANVETAYLTITTPGFAVDDGGEFVTLARRCNEYAARLAADHGSRFRFFTALPMPDVKASLAEIAYGYDALHASGVGLLTSYGTRYLGDPSFAPIFEELNRRAAIVHVHPVDAPCCRGLVPQVPTPVIEFAVDTGRTIASLLWSGTFSRFPRIRFIFSHGGGIVPMIYGRIVGNKRNPDLAKLVPEGPEAALSKLFVDSASITSPSAFAGARTWLGTDKILFGSDYPWTTPSDMASGLASLGLSPTDLEKITRANALGLLGSGKA